MPLCFVLFVVAQTTVENSNAVVFDPADAGRIDASHKIWEQWEADHPRAARSGTKSPTTTSSKSHNESTKRRVTVVPVWADGREGKPPESESFGARIQAPALDIVHFKCNAPTDPFRFSTISERVVISWTGRAGRHGIYGPFQLTAGENSIELPVVDGVEGRIRVVDYETGDPVSGVSLTNCYMEQRVAGLSGSADPTSQDVPVAATASSGGNSPVSDDDGWIRLPHMYSDRSYVVQVAYPGSLERKRRDVFAKDEPIEVRLRKGIEQQVRVVDEAGQLIPGASVWVNHHKNSQSVRLSFERRAITDEHGVAHVFVDTSQVSIKSASVYAEAKGRRGCIVELREATSTGVVLPAEPPLQLRLRADGFEDRIPKNIHVVSMSMRGGETEDGIMMANEIRVKSLVKQCVVSKREGGFLVEVPHVIGRHMWLPIVDYRVNVSHDSDAKEIIVELDDTTDVQHINATTSGKPHRTSISFSVDAQSVIPTPTNELAVNVIPRPVVNGPVHHEVLKRKFIRTVGQSNYEGTIPLPEHGTTLLGLPRLSGWVSVRRDQSELRTAGRVRFELTPSIALRGVVEQWQDFLDGNSASGFLIDSPHSAMAFGASSQRRTRLEMAGGEFFVDCPISAQYVTFSSGRNVLLSQIPWEYKEDVVDGVVPPAWNTEWRNPDQSVIRAIDINGQPVPIKSAKISIPSNINLLGNLHVTDIESDDDGVVRMRLDAARNYPFIVQLNPLEANYKSSTTRVMPEQDATVILKRTN